MLLGKETTLRQCALKRDVHYQLQTVGTFPNPLNVIGYGLERRKDKLENVEIQAPA